MYIKVTDNYGSRNIKLDFEIVGSMLLSPQERSQTAIANTAFIVGEMACEKNIQPLIKAAKNNNIRILQDENITAADIVVQIWIQDRDLLERFHAEIIVMRPREFEYFQGSRLAPKKPLFHSRQIIAQIESDLGELFFKNNYGSSCKVFFFPGDRNIRILIKHQPEKYDVLVYSLADNTLAMSTGTTKWQKQAYLEVIGRQLFGSRDYFLHKPQYTLDPIRDNRNACLYSFDINGIDNIKLDEVVLYYHDDCGTKRIFRSNELFSSEHFLDALTVDTPQIASATFRIYFSGKKERLVKITLPHTVICDVEDRKTIDEWLKARDFLLMGGIDESTITAQATL